MHRGCERGIGIIMHLVGVREITIVIEESSTVDRDRRDRSPFKERSYN